MLVVELLEHVGLELLVLADRLEDLLALLVRGRLDQVGDLRRMQAGEAARGEFRREVGTWPTNGSMSLQGDELVVLGVVSARNGAAGSAQARAEARIDAGHPPGAVLADELDLAGGDQRGRLDVDQAAVEDVGRSRTSPGRRSNCARLSLVVEVRAAAGSELSIRGGHEQLAAADPGLQPDHGRKRSAGSSRATTSSTRPSRSPAESSSGLPATEDRWRIASGISCRGLRLAPARALGYASRGR